MDDLGGLRKNLCASAKLKAPQHCAESLTIDLEDARHQVPTPPDSLATVQRQGLGSRTTFQTVARIPRTRSKSHPRAHELKVMHDIPVPKSPAPALTIANTVELRGLCRQMVEPCATVNLESVPHVSTTAELGEQVEDKRHGFIPVQKWHPSANEGEHSGLKEDLSRSQEQDLSMEIHTSENLSKTSFPHAPLVHVSPLALPSSAPALVINGTAAEHGGLDRDLRRSAKYFAPPQAMQSLTVRTKCIPSRCAKASALGKCPPALMTWLRWGSSWSS
jgi:hypothetical protein